MAHIKLFVICLLLVFISSACLSLAHSSQGQDVDHVDSSAKGLMEDERLATDTSKRIKGRKLAIDSIMKQEKKKKKKKKKDQDGAIAGTTTNQVAGKYESEEGIKGKSTGSNVERKLGSLTRSSDEVKNIDEAGFIPFNADYHPPRHHPPKNN
ncbi:hypothetical protein I3843_06G089400 [Carya illinoinensis]|uniref:uncharacterized protein LOC122314482 n=1 Tax=Carya illinoinensis TaxID=32201 RepID=UPI001C71894E|nr:uncharacterized protein LOC122314482 [Carya illinoinensis]KAG7975261.1 hypothetical protein I3843_06G089400 [Carya illinoinensis]